MSSVPLDSNFKISTNLDDIILLTRGPINYHLEGRYPRLLKKKRKIPEKRFDAGISDHSVPLLSSSEGVDIYVSKKSPLLSAENRKRISNAISNRVLNSDSLKKSREIIPAEYKLVKTEYGVERDLVPAVGYSLKSLRRKLSPPRKLNKVNYNSIAEVFKPLQDEPPPLIVAPIYTFQEQPEMQETLMEVDTPDDEVPVLDTPNTKSMMEVTDVESASFSKDVIDVRKLCVRAVNSVSQTTAKTLNDRFTMLSGYLNVD